MNWTEWIPPREWKLTPLQARVFGALLQHEAVRHDTLIAAAYWDRDEPACVERCLWVMVCQIRKKLGEKLGIKIVAFRGEYRAYCIEPDARRKEIKAAMEAREAELITRELRL